MFVVVGASGKTGRYTAEALLEKKQPVTVVVRSAEKAVEWSSRGAEAAILDILDTERLTELLRGKTGAYLMIPPNYGAKDYIEDRQGVIDSLGRAVRNSKLRQVVFLSSVGAQQTSGTGPILTNHHGEEALKSVARDLTLLRAAYFLENWEPVLAVAREKGILPTFLMPGRKIDMIATKDIGRFAADSLMHGAAGIRITEIAGPKQYAPEEIAGEVGAVLGKEVKLLPLAIDAVVPTFAEHGIPEPTGLLLAEMYQAINSGHVAFAEETKLRRGSVAPGEVFRGLLN